MKVDGWSTKMITKTGRIDKKAKTIDFGPARGQTLSNTFESLN